MYYRGLWWSVYPKKKIAATDENNRHFVLAEVDFLSGYVALIFTLKGKEVLKEIYDLANNNRNK